MHDGHNLFAVETGNEDVSSTRPYIGGRCPLDPQSTSKMMAATVYNGVSVISAVAANSVRSDDGGAAC